LDSFTGAGAAAAATGASGATSFFATFFAEVLAAVELIVVLVPVEVFAIFKRTGIHSTAPVRQILSKFILLYLKRPDGRLFF
jgi:hypothetical protein